MIFILVGSTLLADDFVEARISSHNEYRYADWSHTSANKIVTDVYHVGAPGNNESSVCISYQLPTVKELSIAPFICGTLAKEDHEGGIKFATIATYKKGVYSIDAYYAHFTPLHGTVNPYNVLDAINATRLFGKSWKIGVSTGFLSQNDTWSPLVGPMVRRNDIRGFWFTSYRFGPTNELRFGRTFTVKNIKGEPK